MLTLHIKEQEKHGTVIIPSFDLVMKSNSITAIYSNVTIRDHLIEFFTRKSKKVDGEIFINEKRLEKDTRKQLAIYRLHETFYDRLTVKETIQFMVGMTDQEISMEHVIKNVGLEYNINEKTHRLTFSEKKRLQLALILLIDASVYLFEEPDQNIDIESKKAFVKIIQQLKEAGKTIGIMTTNMESAIGFSDKVYRLTDEGLFHVDITTNETNEAETLPPLSSQAIRLEKIPTKIDDKIVLFDPLEIDYIESYDGAAYLYINGESFPTMKSLQDLEVKLMPYGFFRCHRSYIINLQKVREVITWTRNSYSLTLDDKGKTTIPLSKAKLSTLKEMLGL